MLAHRQRLFFIALALCGVISGCSWVKLSDQAQEVRIVKSTDVSHCQKLGNTSVKTLNKIGIIKRDSYAIQGELNDLARNEAAKLGGNRLVAINQAKLGTQDFSVYRCP